MLPFFLFQGLPKLCLFERVDIVEGVMAAARSARNLVRFQIVHHCHVCRIFKRARPGMAVQAFAIVVSAVKVNGILRGSEPVDIDMVQALKFGVNCAEHRVISVAGIAGRVRVNPVVLEVSGRDIGGIVHVQTLPVRLHDVARETK